MGTFSARDLDARPIDSFARSLFDRDRLCSRRRRTRSLISAVGMNSKHFFWPAADYARNAFEAERKRERERERERERGGGGREETVMCNKCDRFINLSSCVGRREKPRCRSLALLGRCREKERVGGTRARKVTFLRFSPSCTEASGEPRAAKLQAPRRGWRWMRPRVYNAHVVALPPASSVRIRKQERCDERESDGCREKERHLLARVATGDVQDSIEIAYVPFLSIPRVASGSARRQVRLLSIYVLDGLVTCTLDNRLRE